MSQRLGDLLVKEKVITPEQLDQAVKVQKETHVRLASALVKLGFLSDEDVTNFLSRQYGVPALNLSYFEIDASVACHGVLVQLAHAGFVRHLSGHGVISFHAMPSPRNFSQNMSALLTYFSTLVRVPPTLRKPGADEYPVFFRSPIRITLSHQVILPASG